MPPGNLTLEASGFDYRTYTEETDLEGTDNLGCTRTQKKGAVTPQETDPDLSMSVQESLAWVGGDQLQGELMQQ